MRGFERGIRGLVLVWLKRKEIRGKEIEWLGTLRLSKKSKI